MLSERDGRVAKRLHDYRNETYHRDRVRTATVRLAVAIYGDIACRYLRDNKWFVGLGWSSHPKPVPLGLRSYFSTEREMAGFDAYRVVGDALLERLGPLDPDLPALLSENLVERIQMAEASLLEFLEFSGTPPAEASASLDRLLFSFDRDLSDLDAIVKFHKEFGSGQRGKLTTRTIRDWLERAKRLAGIKDPLDAFVGFVDIEHKFEPLEKEAMDAVIAMDRMVEEEIDRRRMK